MCPALWWQWFLTNIVQDIGKNLLTKFHEDRTINVASRVLTTKNAPSPGSHALQPIGTICELIKDIIKTNLLTKFHEDPKINVASSRILTRPCFSSNWNNCLTNPTINVASRVLTRTNVLTKFSEDWTINVSLRVLTRKTTPPPRGHVFQRTRTIFECVYFHVYEWGKTGRAHHCASRTACTIFDLIQDIINTNLLAKFHEDRTINVASRDKCPAPVAHVFQPTRTIFELAQYIIETNLLTKFHDNRTINVASIVLTRKNALPLGGHTNLLAKFNEDRTIN
ncbi:hypothetical protein DPMN_171506 [Dreissena polymorpha]|uniref:Uncharacterized protein n=1 Tax=Dreissena polymorpha TaxID=45954 RepID=A0A9D4E1T7_DREPO|nr:hypothetical protein DPMN_171506 [Dreissena polymorpha]